MMTLMIRLDINLKTSLLHLGLFYYSQPEIGWDSLFLWPPEQKVDTMYEPDLYIYSHLDPRETIGMRGEDRYRHRKLVATATSGDVLVAAGDGT